MSVCLKTWVRLIVAWMAEIQERALKQKFGWPRDTGGSWKKSPVMTSCMPPKGLSKALPSFLPMKSSLSNRSPSTIETDDGHVSYERRSVASSGVTFVDDQD